MTSIKSREDGGKSNRLRSAILLATAMQSHCESLWDLMSITQAVQRRSGSRGEGEGEKGEGGGRDWKTTTDLIHVWLWSSLNFCHSRSWERLLVAGTDSILCSLFWWLCGWMRPSFCMKFCFVIALWHATHAYRVCPPPQLPRHLPFPLISQNF